MPWIYAVFAIGGIIAILAIAVIGASLVHPPWYSGQAFYPWFPLGFFWFWPFFGFLFIFFVARWFFWGWGWRPGCRDHTDAKRILTERYARGEITNAQFEQMKRDLEQ
jgi:uncharacterized membrane protein